VHLTVYYAIAQLERSTVQNNFTVCTVLYILYLCLTGAQTAEGSNAESLFFCVTLTPTPTPGLENLGLPTLTPALKNLDLTLTPNLLCDIMIVYLRLT